MNIEPKPKTTITDRRRGLVYGRNDNYNANQPCLILIHGISDGGNETTELLKSSSHPMWGYLKSLADKYGFNIIWTQSSAHNTTDEIDYALEMAVSDLRADPNKLGLLGVSW